MLRVLGNPKTLCNGITRRDLLTAGAALGLSLPAFLHAQARETGGSHPPLDARQWPFIGSVVSHLERRKSPASARKSVPDNVALPWPFSTQRTGEVHRAGPYPAFLGSQFAPHFTSFHGKATAKITKTLA